jgi:hypothetical protein
MPEPTTLPLLASEASEGAYRRYLETGDSVREILADAVWQAERRGAAAALASLGNTTQMYDPAHLRDWLILHDDKVDLEEVMRRTNDRLGRG